MAKRKPGRPNNRIRQPKAKARLIKAVKNAGTPLTDEPERLSVLGNATKSDDTQRWLPSRSEIGALYQRYSSGARFDEHDKAFYFVLDVGGVSRARQLIAHVEEVLAELEEFRD